MTYPIPDRDVPAVTADQMAEVDRLAVGPYSISLHQMMELAGRALARATMEFLIDASTKVTVLAGGGGNGGGALVAARHLVGFAVPVEVVLDREPARLTGSAAHQAGALEALGIRLSTHPTGPLSGLVVDGLIGYGLTLGATGRAAELIEWSADAKTIVSLDVPSGMNATTGEAPGPAVVANTTVTLALPKTGLVDNKRVGRLLLADIAIPPALWSDHFGWDLTGLFATNDVLDLGVQR